MKKILGIAIFVLSCLFVYGQGQQIIKEVTDQRGNIVSIGLGDIMYMYADTETGGTRMHQSNRRDQYLSADTLSNIVSATCGLFLTFNKDADNSVVAINSTHISKIAMSTDSTAVVIVDRKTSFDVTQTYASTMKTLGSCGIGITGYVDNTFSIMDNTDATKIAAFLVDSITTGTTRTYIFPDYNGTFVLEDASGNVGIGVLPATSRLDVAGTSEFYYLNPGTGNQTKLEINSSTLLGNEGFSAVTATGAGDTLVHISLSMSESANAAKPTFLVRYVDAVTGTISKFIVDDAIASLQYASTEGNATIIADSAGVSLLGDTIDIQGNLQIDTGSPEQSALWVCTDTEGNGQWQALTIYELLMTADQTLGATDTIVFDSIHFSLGNGITATATPGQYKLIDGVYELTATANVATATEARFKYEFRSGSDGLTAHTPRVEAINGTGTDGFTTTIHTVVDARTDTMLVCVAVTSINGTPQAAASKSNFIIKKSR